MAKHWRFFLRSALRGEAELLHEPENWRSRETKLVRDMKLYGISLEISSPFVFIKDGAAYVRDVFNRLGYNAEVFVDVFEYDAPSGRYVSYFSGQLIMKTIDLETSRVSVQATPTAISRILKDRESKEVDITTPWTMDNEIQPEIEIIVGNLASHSRVVERQISGVWTESRVYTLGVGELLQIGFDELAVDEMPGWIKERATIDTTEVFPILKVEEGGDYTFDVAFVIQVGTNSGDELEFFYKVGRDGTPVPVSTVFSTIVDGGTFYLFTVTCTDTVALVPGDQLYFYAVCGSATTARLRVGGVGRPASLPDDVWKLTGATTYSSIASTGVMAFEVCEKILQTMLGAEVKLYSNALGRTDLGYSVDAAPGMCLICSGQGLAGKDITGFKASFKKVFSDGLAPLYNLGVATTQATDGSPVVLIEEMPYFFQRKIGITINGVSELHKRTADNLIYSGVHVGFTKYESKLTGAAQDPHSKSEYLIPGLFVEETLDIRSSLIGSSWKIEEQRRNFTASTSQSSNDTDLYVIKVKPFEGPVFQWQALRDEDYDLVSGVPAADTLFNLDLTPHRVIRRWGPNIAACYYRGSDLLRWASSETTSDLQTQLATEDFPVKERQSINSLELGEPLWLPEIYEFSAKLDSLEDRELIAKKYEIIEVIDGEDQYFGYLLERTRNEKNEAQFTLLRANYNG